LTDNVNQPQTHADDHGNLSRATCSAQISHRFAKENWRTMEINDVTYAVCGLANLKQRKVSDLPEGHDK
jgi:hypothetical protein